MTPAPVWRRSMRTSGTTRRPRRARTCKSPGGCWGRREGRGMADDGNGRFSKERRWLEQPGNKVRIVVVWGRRGLRRPLLNCRNRLPQRPEHRTALTIRSELPRGFSKNSPPPRWPADESTVTMAWTPAVAPPRRLAAPAIGEGQHQQQLCALAQGGICSAVRHGAPMRFSRRAMTSAG
jgi:hypothetical protein